MVLIVNGVLWSAQIEVDDDGAASDISEDQLEEIMTPRTPKTKKKK